MLSLLHVGYCLAAFYGVLTGVSGVYPDRG
jgi:hypothetical protein